MCNKMLAHMYMINLKIWVEIIKLNEQNIKYQTMMIRHPDTYLWYLNNKDKDDE